MVDMVDLYAWALSAYNSSVLESLCSHALSPVVRIAISRFGVRPMIILGTVVIALSMEMAALVTQVKALQD